MENINLSKINNIIVIVGAGASAASGLKTFRGSDGLYQGKMFEELASRYGFEKDPELVWNWYKERMTKVLEVKPNPIHKALVKLETAGLLELIITQNVDGLHTKAGQTKFVEIHGNIMNSHCLDNCGHIIEWDHAPKEIPVICKCGSYQRPSVVWFGEKINEDVLIEIQQSLDTCQLMLIIGTSGVVYPTAQFPIIVKQSNNSYLVEFNTENSAFENIDDLFIQGPAEETVPEFVDILISLSKNH